MSPLSVRLSESRVKDAPKLGHGQWYCILTCGESSAKRYLRNAQAIHIVTAVRRSGEAYRLLSSKLSIDACFAAGGRGAEEIRVPTTVRVCAVPQITLVFILS